MAALILTAPIAHADPTAEQAYLDSLEAFGFTVHDPVVAIETGYAACGQLNFTTGDVVAARLHEAYPDEFPDAEIAGAAIVAAAMNLCNWNWHPERGA